MLDFYKCNNNFNISPILDYLCINFHALKRLTSILCLLSFSVLAAAQKPAEVEDTLNTSYVTAVKEKPRNTTQTGLAHLDNSFLKRGAVAFGTPDIIRSLLTLPGVAAGNELMSGLSVHGGDGTDNLFLLDGVPIYNISHFGGIFSSFNTDITDGLDFYKSGFPARYGSKLSSVVDVETKEGDMYHYHGNVSLGLIDGRIHVEGPIVKGKTSFNFAYRRSWMDMMISLAMLINKTKDTKAAYFMNDLNAGITHKFNDDNTLRVNFYWGKDDLDLGLYPEGLDMDLGVKWGNLIGSASWNHKFSRELSSGLIAYYTQSTSKTDYLIQMDADGISDLISSGLRDAGVKYGLDWFPTDSHHVRAGASLDWKMYRYVGQAEDPSNPDSPSPKLSHDRADASVFIEDEFFISRHFTLNAGLRYTLYGGTDKTWHSVEPRAALKWSPSRLVDVKLSYSRMSQADHLVASSYLDLPSNTWMPSTDRIRPVLSDQVSGGVYLKPFQGMNINLEGWFKTMNRLQYYIGPNSMFPPVQNWETSFTEGEGQSYGLEAEFSWHNDKIEATGYYTLNWSRRRFDAVYPDWFYANNDNRHKLNLLFSYQIIKALQLNANWSYHTGNRITFPTNVTPDGTFLYSEPHNFTLPHYHRLDLALSYSVFMKKSQALQFDLSIYNVYNHKNAFFAYLEPDGEGGFDGKAYSIMPIFPTLSITYKF